MEEDLKIVKNMAHLITKNIRDVTTALTMNINYDKPYTILAAYSAAYAVTSYFEYKLTKLGITPGAIQKAKESADKYVIDVISHDTGNFSIDKGDA
jgi:hypothetical protein